jgi:hypothetical protein
VVLGADVACDDVTYLHVKRIAINDLIINPCFQGCISRVPDCRGLISRVPWATGYGPTNLDTTQFSSTDKQLASHTPYTGYDPTTL